MTLNLILASESPRRHALLKQAHIPFTVVSKHIEEVMDMQLPLQQCLEKLAFQKANAVFADYPDDLILGADTIVYLNGQILQKPVDREDASNMLHALSNQKHVVYTAVCLLSRHKKITFVEKTYVYFKLLSEKVIQDYLMSGEWVDKAGAYAIQGQASVFVDHIEGDLHNVIGLPLDTVIEKLKEFKEIVA